MDVDKPSFSVYSARAHEKRGLGYSSRFRVSATDLPPGWRMEKKSSKNTVWYDSDGTRYRSSIEVEEALRRASTQKLTLLSETETETGGETASEYEPSPVKKPRSSLSV